MFFEQPVLVDLQGGYRIFRAFEERFWRNRLRGVV